MHRYQTVLITFLVIFASFEISAQVLRYRPGQYSLFASYEIMDTNANFDAAGGSFTKLDTNRSFSHTEMPITLQYDFNRDLAILGGINIAGSESYYGSYTLTKNVISKFTAGVQYKALKKPFLVVPQILVTLPFETITDDNALVSDGAMEIEGGAWLQKKIWKLYTYMYLGFTYRDSDLSMLGKYKLGAYTRLHNFYVGGNVSGFSSLVDDGYTNNPTARTNVTRDTTAGSLMFYSINPEVLEVEGWAGFIVNNNFLAKVGYKQGVNGANYAKTGTFWFGVDIRNFYTKSVEERANQARTERINNMNEHFEPEEDTMDDGDFSEDELEKEIEFQFDKENKPLKK